MLFSAYPTVRLNQARETYDYIIIGELQSVAFEACLIMTCSGGGTAGCVIANRLSGNPNVTVLLVESGEHSNSWLTRSPLFSFHHVTNGSRSLVTPTTPQPRVGNRVFDLIRGRSLGGTSRINGMFYSRSIPAEFNAWSIAGRDGWSYEEIEKYFVRGEHAVDYTGREAPNFHGTRGDISGSQ